MRVVDVVLITRMVEVVREESFNKTKCITNVMLENLSTDSSAYKVQQHLAETAILAIVETIDDGEE